MNNVLWSHLFSSVLTDTILYPLDTCILRLQQVSDFTEGDCLGMVQPLSTNYVGFKNCIYRILYEEGISGFYRGFGALIMQYTAKGFVALLLNPS